jgi:flagellar basal body-associated protein FliL
MADAPPPKAAKEPAVAEVATTASPGLIKRTLPYAIGGVLASGFGVFAGIVTAPKHEEPEVTVETTEPAPTPLDQLLPPHTIAVPQFLAGLASQGAPATARISMTLEVRVKTAEAQAAFDLACAAGGEVAVKVNDALLHLLSGKPADALRTPRGMEELKLEIRDRLNPLIFPDPSVGTLTGVFFKELLIG